MGGAIFTARIHLYIHQANRRAKTTEKKYYKTKTIAVIQVEILIQLPPQKQQQTAREESQT